MPRDLVNAATMGKESHSPRLLPGGTGMRLLLKQKTRIIHVLAILVKLWSCPSLALLCFGSTLQQGRKSVNHFLGRKVSLLAGPGFKRFPLQTWGYVGKCNLGESIVSNSLIAEVRGRESFFGMPLSLPGQLQDIPCVLIVSLVPFHLIICRCWFKYK